MPALLYGVVCVILVQQANGARVWLARADPRPSVRPRKPRPWPNRFSGQTDGLLYIDTGV